MSQLPEVKEQVDAKARAANVRRYERVMAPYEREKMLLIRGELVRKYRANPQVWPDGIDGLPGSGNEQWYRGHEAEWLDDGTYVGVTPVTESPPSSVTESPLPKVAADIVASHMGRPKSDDALSSAEKQRRYRERLAAARAVLTEAESRVKSK